MPSPREAPHVLTLNRLDGGELRLDAYGLAAHFFKTDPSSIAVGAYDSLAGRTARDRIERSDIEALNRTMRARTPHARWEHQLGTPLSWLGAISPDLDLIQASDSDWQSADGDRLVEAALLATVVPGVGVAVATKLLHLKRPRLFPVLDSLVAQMLGAPAIGEGPPGPRVAQALRLVNHLRTEGRRNLDELQRVQRDLQAAGIDRSLVRILDAALWLSHPAAGLSGTTKSITVGLRE
jgi:hypothetical protein